MMPDKVNLVIYYNVQNVHKIPDLKITVLSREYTIPNNRSMTITIDKGEYDILFKIPFFLKAAKLDYHITLEGDVQLDIGWNRFWGKITVKEIATHVRL